MWKIFTHYVPYKYRKIVNNLSRNKNIVIMNHYKGRGVVVMDRGNILMFSYAKYRPICATTERSNKFFTKESPGCPSKIT